MKNNSIEQTLLSEFRPEIVALAYHWEGRKDASLAILQEICDGITEEFDHYFRVGSKLNEDFYIVCTDEVAEELWQEDLEQYLQECIIDELPDHVQGYFNSEAWFSDARLDGRGHCLGRYSGEEHSESVAGTDYFIFQQE